MSRAALSWTEAVAAFEQSLHDCGRAETTIATYMSALRVFAGFYCDELEKPGPYVARLQETDLQAFVAHLREQRPLSASSINRFVVALHAFCQHAVEQRWMRRNVARDLRTYRPPLPATAPRLSLSEVNRLAASVDLHGRNGRRDLVIVQLLLHTGMRVRELSALAVGDVTLLTKTGKVRIRSDKAHAERVLPLNRAAFSALRAYLQSRGSPAVTEPLLVSERRGRMGVVTIQHHVKKLLTCAGRPDLSAHALRHHFAVQLYAKTGNLTAVQEALGHSSIVTTARYARATSQEIEQAVEALPGNVPWQEGNV